MLTKNLQIRGKRKSIFVFVVVGEIKSKTYNKRKYCSNKC